MSSPCQAAKLALAAAAALSVAACDREARTVAQGAPESSPQIQATSLTPGGPRQMPADADAAKYENNAYQVSAGSRIFRTYNCNGCHSNGGGGMGPPLIDDQWIYGSSIEQIYGTILEGRPNGMPAWRGKLTDEQIWQVAAYVRTLGGFNPSVASARRDAMASVPPRNQVDTSGKRAGQ